MRRTQALMMNFELPPKGKARPKFTRTGHAYTPKPTVLYENYLQIKMMEEMVGHEIMTGPVEMEIYFAMPEPKSMRKKDKGQKLPHVKKPDLDNLEKALMDAANGIVFKDDSQVWMKRSQKKYSTNPGISVVFKERMES